MDGEIEAGRSAGWYELLDLAMLCPTEVEEICDTKGKALPLAAAGQHREKLKITGTTRLLQIALARHADGLSNKCWPGLKLLTVETGADPRTVDRAIATLTRAGLLTSQQAYNPDGSYARTIRTMNRERLRHLVGPKPEEAGLMKALEDVQGAGESFVLVRELRREQTKSRLFHLAGDFRIRIDEEPGGGDTCHLHIRPEEHKLDAEWVTGSTAHQSPAIAAANSDAFTRKAKMKAAPAPIDVVNALMELPEVGLERHDAERLAAVIANKYGEDGALIAVAELEPNALAGAADADSKGAYLRVCIEKEFSAWMNQMATEMFEQARAVDSPTLRFNCARELSEKLGAVQIEYIRRCAGEEFEVSNYQTDPADNSLFITISKTEAFKNI